METLTLDAIELVDPDLYAKRGYPHDAWTLLRREAPVYRYERANVEPFWVITRHAEIVEISRQPELFRNGQMLFLALKSEPIPEQPLLSQILNMNPPEHGEYRGVASSCFTPRVLRERLAARIEELTTEVIDQIADREECDFVTEVAAKLPVAVIAEMFGIPRSDWDLMFHLSNAIVGAGDSEYNRGRSMQESMQQARMEFFQYFTKLIEQRRKNPQDDVASALANAQVQGGPMPPFEQLSYFALLIIAGNETTRNAISGGLHAFVNHPDQWMRLKYDPSLALSAAEEVLRWTSPIIHFVRTATAETELRGHKIRAGDTVAMFYPSANRDDTVFEDPFKFDIGRRPNRHLAFGIGEHYCLGANLARLELQAMFRQLAQRLESLEITGPVGRLRANFVGGIKHMPVRYRMSAAKKMHAAE